MKYFLFILLSVPVAFYSQTKFSIQLESGWTPISSINSTTLWSFQGQLGVDYKVSKSINLGFFWQSTMYYKNMDLANIDNKIIEMSSIEYNSVGIYTAYNYAFKKLIFQPKIDIGYNIFTAKSLDFETNKDDFLDYKYLSVCPKLALNYAISEGFSLGVFSGYNCQLFALKGQKLAEFNPNAVVFGINSSINIK